MNEKGEKEGHRVIGELGRTEIWEFRSSRPDRGWDGDPGC